MSGIEVELGTEVTIEGRFTTLDGDPLEPVAAVAATRSPEEPDQAIDLPLEPDDEEPNVLRATFTPDAPGDWPVRMADGDEATSTIVKTLTVSVERRRVPAP